MCFSAPKVSMPAPPPMPVEKITNDESMQAMEAERRRRAAAAGYQSTIKTSGQGVLSEAPTTKKTLLGA